jgi:hypothetical protein
MLFPYDDKKKHELLTQADRKCKGVKQRDKYKGVTVMQ